MLLEGLDLGQRLGLGGEGVRGAAALADPAEASLDPLGERLTGQALHSLDVLLDTAVGTDPESDGSLGHGRCRDGTDGVERC